MEVNCYSVTNLTHQLFALTVSEMETVYFHIEGDYGGKSISFTWSEYILFYFLKYYINRKFSNNHIKLEKEAVYLEKKVAAG